MASLRRLLFWHRAASKDGGRTPGWSAAISEELDHIHGRFFLGNYHDTYHGPHTKENTETIFEDVPKETHG